MRPRWPLDAKDGQQGRGIESVGVERVQRGIHKFRTSLDAVRTCPKSLSTALGALSTGTQASSTSLGTVGTGAKALSTSLRTFSTCPESLGSLLQTFTTCTRKLRTGLGVAGTRPQLLSIALEYPGSPAGWLTRGENRLKQGGQR